MEHFIKNITRRLVEQLPEDKSRYRLKDLITHGFPKFVVERIRVELQRNLAESIILPNTEWANMESEAVRRAWDQFVSAIRSQARLPQSFAYPVVETAISDILDILVQPRKNLPDVIFGADDSLEYEELKERTESIVVYRHFATLLPRYMEKRNIDVLSKERCSRIIAQADEKLVRDYTPLNWAQMLEPLFILMKGQIDSNLVRLFYEDKNRPRLARQFDLMSRTLSRSQLIEVLSTPDLADEEQPQNELFETRPTPPEQSGVETSWQGLAEPDSREEKNINIQARQQPETDPEQPNKYSEMESEQEESEPALHESFNEPVESNEAKEESKLEPAPSVDQDQQEDKNAENDEEDGNDDWSLNDVFEEEKEAPVHFDLTDEEKKKLFEDESEAGELESESEKSQEGTAEEDHVQEQDDDQPRRPDYAYHRMRTAFDPYKKPDSDTDFEKEKDKDIDFEYQVREDYEQEKESSDEEEQPMWQRFMSSQESSEEKHSVQNFEDEDDTPAESELEPEPDPIIDLRKEKDTPPGKIKEIRKYLKEDRQRFVDNIFKGGEEAYEQALEEIAEKEDWRSASQFIHRHIFKRNLVDMYSESAVDFTDQLQSYFMNKTKSN